ncbi:hypothetical protein SH584_11525 [Sphingomonas sp. LY29]|uniref:hypothetical protein n=1 Tax=Sphingomonas sp. LY29 TaxID=3095341 RepID=UPI002D766D2E|nr:hypothetical protein [Sphingomonas sp. LY29]WRP25661.1 hypothetical protein SH584_11525 [Sphingomonas sp. LY29]
MQQQMVDEAGNIWEVDAAGNPIRMVQGAQAPAAGRVFNLGMSPKEARQEARLEETDARADRRESRAISTEERKADNDALSNELKRLELRLKEQELSKGESGGRTTALKSLVNQINRVQTLFNTGPGTTSGLGAVQDYLPTGPNKAFDAAGASLSAQGLAAFRVPGTGTVSDRDAIMFDRANLPQASNFDDATLEQLRGLRTRVEGEYEAMGLGKPAWDGIGQKADNEVPDPSTGADLKPPADMRDPANYQARTSAASGDRRVTYDARMSSQIDSLINAGASKATIDAILKRQNFPVVSPQEWTAIQGWKSKNPGKKYFGANISRTDDLSIGQQIAGSAPGAFLAQMANSATAGIPAALAGDQGKGALDAMAAANPNASMAGQLTGAVTGAMGAEAAIAARAPAAIAAYAPRIADGLFGAATGFNQAQEGEGLADAGKGAVAGVLGGFVGERVLRGIGAATRGVQNPYVRTLRDQGVPLTVGQTVGDSGNIGSTIKNIEDALTSIPGVSSVINARRTEGLEGFDRAAFQAAGAPAGINVDAIGAQGMEQLRNGIGPAYDNALGGAQINANDPGFLQAVEELVQASNRIPPVGGAREAAAAAIENRIGGAVDPTTGAMTGRGFQEAYRGLGRTARERANGDYGHEVGQVMRQGQNVLADALDEQNPGALEAFRNANAVNRNANVLAQALNSAKNQGDEVFTPAQLNTADASSARRLEGPMASAAGDRPFFDLARAGQQILPSKLPDSGTATRGIVGATLVGGLGGAGVGSAFGDPGSGAQLGLGATLLLAAGGSRPAQRAMVNILAERPDVAQQLGQRIMQGSRFGGAFGAGAATPLAVGYGQ